MGITTFLWFVLIVTVLGAISRAILISISTYPRFQKVTAGYEVILLLVQIGYIVWTALLLFD